MVLSEMKKLLAGVFFMLVANFTIAATEEG